MAQQKVVAKKKQTIAEEKAVKDAEKAVKAVEKAIKDIEKSAEKGADKADKADKTDKSGAAEKPDGPIETWSRQQLQRQAKKMKLGVGLNAKDSKLRTVLRKALNEPVSGEGAATYDDTPPKQTILPFMKRKDWLQARAVGTLRILFNEKGPKHTMEDIMSVVSFKMNSEETVRVDPRKPCTVCAKPASRLVCMLSAKYPVNLEKWLLVEDLNKDMKTVIDNIPNEATKRECQKVAYCPFFCSPDCFNMWHACDAAGHDVMFKKYLEACGIYDSPSKIEGSLQRTVKVSGSLLPDQTVPDSVFKKLETAYKSVKEAQNTPQEQHRLATFLRREEPAEALLKELKEAEAKKQETFYIPGFGEKPIQIAKMFLTAATPPGTSGKKDEPLVPKRAGRPPAPPGPEKKKARRS